MSKTTTILSAAVLLAGTSGGLGAVMTPPIAVSASAGDTQLYENYYDDFFEMTRLNPNTGSVRLTFKVPEEQTLKRVVVARPGDDRYRLISELDGLALRMLDGEIEGLELSETPDSELTAWNGWFDRWVGTWDDLGSEFLKRNPADVMYIGLVLQDAKTGEEIKYYHKIDYRSCAHEQPILSGEIIMCEAKKHGERKAVYLPESVDIASTPPTWEEELAMLAKKTVEEDFDALEALEAVLAEGGEIEMAQIEELEERGEEMKFAKFPDITEVKAVKADYLARVEALKRVIGNGQEVQEPQEPSVPVVTPVNPVGSNGSGGSGIQSTTVSQNVAPVQNVLEVQSVLGSQSTLTDLVGDAGVEALAPEFGAESDAERTEIEVPKLGGSWWECYGTALLIAGASLAGVMGWFLIAVIGKKRKRDER